MDKNTAALRFLKSFAEGQNICMSALSTEFLSKLSNAGCE